MSSYYESAPYNLLLVDDEESIRAYFCALLKETAPNITVLEARNGTEAIDSFKSNKPDCVLLDYQLPDMNALQVISAIQDGPTLSRPVIIFTGHEIENLDLELMEVGATDFLYKTEITQLILKRTIYRAIVRFQYGNSQHYYEKTQQLIQEKKAIEKATQAEKKKLREANKQLKFMAMHDSLTGLANRVMLLEHLQRSIASSKRRKQKFYTLFIDLDRFKNVNDSLGHSCGDVLLLEMVNRVRKIIRAEDIMARVGGDEFVIILDGCLDIQGAHVVCKKINEVVAKKYVVENNDIFISASIGLSVYPENGTSPDELIEKADSAMYMAKGGGKNTFKSYEEGGDNLPESFSIESDLHSAIAKNEFSIYFQPQISLQGGEVYGAEALLRWNSKNHGNVSPGVFIPIAEESDLIIELGAWVREQAFKQLDCWKSTPFSHLRIAVNVSGREFIKGGLMDQLAELQERYEIEPSLVELEITERTIVEQSNLKNNAFDQLRSLGYGLSIDDFGTGYSSLSYLKSIPITELKIDRSFISSSNNQDLAITSTIISMAKNLGVRSIAEGVEEKEQLDFLERIGCDHIQGYFFTRPLPREDFETWVLDYMKASEPGSRRA